MGNLRNMISEGYQDYLHDRSLREKAREQQRRKEEQQRQQLLLQEEDPQQALEEEEHEQQYQIEIEREREYAFARDVEEQEAVIERVREMMQEHHREQLRMKEELEHPSVYDSRPAQKEAEDLESRANLEEYYVAAEKEELRKSEMIVTEYERKLHGPEINTALDLSNKPGRRSASRFNFFKKHDVAKIKHSKEAQKERALVQHFLSDHSTRVYENARRARLARLADNKEKAPSSSTPKPAGR